MAQVTRSEVSIEVIDHDGDRMITTLQGSGSTALTYADVANDADAIMDALAGIVDGNIVSRTLKANREYNTIPTNATPVQSQTSRQWVMEMQDSVTGRIYTARLGTAAPEKAGNTTAVINGVVELDLTAGNGLALATAFASANFAPLSPLGNAMTLQRVYLRD
jgi:hypothetical protein